MEIVFASKNAGKILEVSKIMEQTGYRVISMEEAGISVDIEETGTTYEDNALIKANEVCRLTGKIAMADDSGIEIDFMDGKPGVYSSRYLGEKTPYDEKNAIILDILKNVPEEKRGARYVASIACVFPDGMVLTTRAALEGYIGREPKGMGGFGYDPIFFLPDGHSVAEIPAEEKNRISHRAKALAEMKIKLQHLSADANAAL